MASFWGVDDQAICVFDNFVKLCGQFFSQNDYRISYSKYFCLGAISISQDWLLKHCNYLGIQINFCEHQRVWAKLPTCWDVESYEMKFFRKIARAFLFVFMV